MNVNYYNTLISSLRLLSLSYKEQKKYFPDFVDVPFEILDSYCHAFLLIPVLVENEMFSYKQISMMLSLNFKINSLLQSPFYLDAKTDQDIINLSDWKTIADISKEILVLMKQDKFSLEEIIV